MKCDRKKKIYIIISCIAFIFVSILIYNILFVKSKPPGMSDQTFRAGCEIVNLTDKYLNVELTKTEAYNKISKIDDVLNNKDTSNLGVRIHSSSIMQELSTPYPDDNEILKDRNKLAGELGIK